MKRLLLLLLLALFAQATWAAVGCTIYTRSSDGDDADDGSTWALANKTLVGSLSDWGTSDIICISNEGHTETQTGAMTLLATGDTAAIPVPIISVSDVDDTYVKATACQVSVTGSADMFLGSGTTYFAIAGVEFCSGDNISITGAADQSIGLEEVNFTLSSSGAKMFLTLVPKSEIRYWKGGTIDFSHASGGSLSTDDSGIIEFDGVTFAGNAASGGLFRGTSGGPAHYRCLGCDLSAMSGEVLADVSTSGSAAFRLELIGSLLPATVTIHDSGFVSYQQRVYISGTDDATGNESFRQDLYTYNGDITTSTSVRHDTGLQFTEGSTRASLKFEPASHISEYEPLCSWLVATEWINTTESKTFTTEIVENYTTALTLAQVWQEIFYLGTSSSPDWSLDLGQSIGSTTSLASGTGCGNWTGEPATCRSAKLETTITVNKAGLYSVRYCVGAFESGRVVHVDTPSVS